MGFFNGGMNKNGMAMHLVTRNKLSLLCSKSKHCACYSICKLSIMQQMCLIQLSLKQLTPVVLRKCLDFRFACCTNLLQTLILRVLSDEVR